MVEFTVPLLLDIIRTAGILVGIVYYITIMRNSRKNQQMQLETRQLDVYMRWQQDFTKPEVVKNFMELRQLEWDDFDDFANRYSHNVNPEEASKRFAAWYYFDGLGYILSRGMIDADTVFEMTGNPAISHWIRFEPIIRGFRERDGRPETWKWFEYLADEMKKVRERRGMPEYTPGWRPETS